ncbi:MAG TPA: choice-of-anchor tandem repeat GloVer-containing protein [Candidatus Cybelea sp.]|jgi:uncharacterized repeat protein (TIGR03803 family)|nr:choice-of-anchor tandem repeat GloVer-containing protein [Candidatus Cybelea sp.]
MRVSSFGHAALGACAVFALLEGCSGTQAPIGAPGAVPQASTFAPRTTTTNYRVIYDFGEAPDGSYPTARLIDVSGALYGTTAGGGSNSCAYYPYSPYHGCGTVFTVTPSGTEKVLYKFGPAPDGSVPYGDLLDVSGKRYGTTVYGGAYTCGYPSQPFSCGTVFSISTSGAEKVLHNFGHGGDGQYPVAGLIKVKGTLYGTTSGGGANYCASSSYDIRCGTVFSITTSGTEKVLHNFGKGTDGTTPLAGLIEVNGTLYGTTKYGGKHGFGTVFSITTSGTEKVLHSFGKGTDGATPLAGLIVVKGELYGTTENGGANTCGGSSDRYSCGTVFSITTSGAEKVLRSFGRASDGYSPVAGLTEVNGTLYGTTYLGGAHAAGTLFSITTSGTEKVLHSFGSSSDGRLPYAGLTDVNGTLYGTTYTGGAYNDGTIFALKP